MEVNSVHVIAKVGIICLIFVWRTLVANFRQKKALCSDPLVVQLKKMMQGNVSNKENLTEVLPTILLQTLNVSLTYFC